MFDWRSIRFRSDRSHRRPPDTLDLKIATAALAEMRDAYEMFTPYKARTQGVDLRSARTKPDDPLYAQARNLAALLADAAG